MPTHRTEEELDYISLRSALTCCFNSTVVGDAGLDPAQEIADYLADPWRREKFIRLFTEMMNDPSKTWREKVGEYVGDWYHKEELAKDVLLEIWRVSTGTEWEKECPEE